VTQRLYQRLVAECSNKPPEQQMIGAAFLEVVNDLKVYKPYCINHPTSNETINKLRSQNVDFDLFLNAVKRQFDVNRNLNITDQLIKPFQRIVRYSMLLKELLHSTPEAWPDHKNIAQAVTYIDLIVTQTNEDKRITDNLLKIIEIQNSIIWQGEVCIHSLSLSLSLSRVNQVGDIDEDMMAVCAQCRRYNLERRIVNSSSKATFINTSRKARANATCSSSTPC